MVVWVESWEIGCNGRRMVLKLVGQIILVSMVTNHSYQTHPITIKPYHHVGCCVRSTIVWCSWWEGECNGCILDLKILEGDFLKRWKKWRIHFPFPFHLNFSLKSPNLRSSFVHQNSIQSPEPAIGFFLSFGAMFFSFSFSFLFFFFFFFVLKSTNLLELDWVHLMSKFVIFLHSMAFAEQVDKRSKVPSPSPSIKSSFWISTKFTPSQLSILSFSSTFSLCPPPPGLSG